MIHLALERSGLPPLAPPPRDSGWRLLDLREATDAALDPHFNPRDGDQVIVIDHYDLPGDAADMTREMLLRATHGRRLVLLCDRPAQSLLARDGQLPRPLLDPAELAQKARQDAFLVSDIEELERWLVQSGAGQRHVLDVMEQARGP